MAKRNNQQKLLYFTRPNFYNKVLEELNQLDEIICWLLMKHEHFRNCDKCLIWHVWEEVDKLQFMPDKDKKHSLTSSESIRRVRQKLQELGLWIPTDPEVIKKRNIKKQAISDWVVNYEKIQGKEYIGDWRGNRIYS